MKYNDAGTGTRLRSAVTLAVAVWALVIGAEWGFAWADTAPAHLPHAVAAAPGAHFAVPPAEHHHLQDGSTPGGPQAFTAAVLPRLTTALVSLGVFAAVCLLGCWASRVVAAAVRGPPGTLAAILTGQQRLIRLCIARR